MPKKIYYKNGKNDNNKILEKKEDIWKRLQKNKDSEFEKRTNLRTENENNQVKN